MKDDVVKVELLLVDDNESIRRTWPEVLESWEYTVHTAESEADAREQLLTGRAHPNLVLLDLVLDKITPESGISALRAIHGLAPDACILLFTSFARPHAGYVADALQNGGAWAFIDKDEPAELIRIKLAHEAARHAITRCVKAALGPLRQACEWADTL